MHVATFVSFINAPSAALNGRLFAEIRTLAPEAPPHRHWLAFPFSETTVNDAVAWALRENAAGRHVFFSAQPRNTLRGRVEDVPLYQCFALDFDPKGGDPAEKVARLHAAGLVPTIEANSGHGRHAYYCLTKPVAVHEGFPVARRLARWAASDAVFSPSQMMRLPGTYNVKPGGPPVPCEVTAFRPEQRLGADQIDFGLDLLGAPKLAPEEMVPHSRSKRSADHSLSLTLDGLDPDERRRLEEVWSWLPQRYQRLAKDPRARGYPSRSEGVMGMARELRYAGAERDEAETFFRLFYFGIGARVMESGLGWLDGTLDKVYRGPDADEEASEVLVRRVSLDARGLDVRRWQILLRVERGPFAGEVFEGRIDFANPKADEPRWFMFMAFGRAPTSDEAALRALVGHRAWVVLMHGDHGIRVRRWVRPR